MEWCTPLFLPHAFMITQCRVWPTAFRSWSRERGARATLHPTTRLGPRPPTADRRPNSSGTTPRQPHTRSRSPRRPHGPVDLHPHRARPILSHPRYPAPHRPRRRSTSRRLGEVTCPRGSAPHPRAGVQRLARTQSALLGWRHRVGRAPDAESGITSTALPVISWLQRWQCFIVLLLVAGAVTAAGGEHEVAEHGADLADTASRVHLELALRTDRHRRVAGAGSSTNTYRGMTLRSAAQVRWA